jgi:hypothetical protein
VTATLTAMAPANPSWDVRQHPAMLGPDQPNSKSSTPESGRSKSHPTRSPPYRSGCIAGRMAQIPKLIVRVRSRHPLHRKGPVRKHFPNTGPSFLLRPNRTMGRYRAIRSPSANCQLFRPTTPVLITRLRRTLAGRLRTTRLGVLFRRGKRLLFEVKYGAERDVDLHEFIRV